MKILNLIIIYVFAQVIYKLMEKRIKKEGIGLSPIEEMIVGIVMFICGAISVIVAIAFPIALFF